MTRPLKVREGNTGILYLTDESGEQERFIPDYDLDKARALLLEFQELKDFNGKSIKDNYWRDGHNWFPTMVNFLYGRVLLPYVKYKPLADRFINRELQFEFLNKADFHGLLSILEGKPEGGLIKNSVFNTLLRLNNWYVLQRFRANLLFFRFTPDDFRTSSAKKVLDKLQASYIEVLAPDRRLLLSNLIEKRPYYFFGGMGFKNFFRRSYRIDGEDPHKKELFEKAIRRIERMMSSFVLEYRRHCRALKGKAIRTFYGIDDTQVVYPILYACQHQGIKTITHQHGAAYNKRHASYIMEGIAKEDYRWFDKIIVWGKYWSDILLKNSKVYSPDMFIEGSSLFEFDYSNGTHSPSQGRNVLVPYEFLTNTYKVGLYVKKLIDLEYSVFFKPRSDEVLRDQLDAYCLPPSYVDKITIVYSITPEFMQTIDIVVGTMTTLVYQLLPYNKIIWILDTEYRYLEHLVEEGLAQKVKYEDLDGLEEHYFKKTEVQARDFFNSEPLEETLKKHVLNGDPLAREKNNARC